MKLSAMWARTQGCRGLRQVCFRRQPFQPLEELLFLRKFASREALVKGPAQGPGQCGCCGAAG